MTKIHFPRYIFLDIDGVLTSQRVHAAYDDNATRMVWHRFDPVAIQMLNRISEKWDDVHFVLSSTWRNVFDQKTMTMFMSQAGWRGKWHSNWKTPHADCYPHLRGHDIDQWLKESGGKDYYYVIIDDNSDMLPHQKDHLVLTNPQDGMNSLSYLERAIEILKKKPDNQINIDKPN